MPRQGRINIEGGIYHVIQRGIERRKIFRDDADRKEFICRLGEGLNQTGHKCNGWVLMPNHFHLLIRTGTRPLSELMRKLSTGYALYFNKRYKRSGYLYQGRYKSILCQEDSYLLELVRYIHLNPMRAGLVRDMEGLNEYKWSGHGVLIGKIKMPWQSTDEVLGMFGKKKREAIKGYRRFVGEGKDLGRRDELSGGGLIRSAGGWKEVMKLKKSKERWTSDERMLGDGGFVEDVLRQADEEMERREKLKKEGWNLDKVVERVCKLLNVEVKDIKRLSKRSRIAQAKSLAAYFANNELKISGREISRYFGITPSSVSSSIKRGKEIAEENEYRII